MSISHQSPVAFSIARQLKCNGNPIDFQWARLRGANCPDSSVVAGGEIAQREANQARLVLGNRRARMLSEGGWLLMRLLSNEIIWLASIFLRSIRLPAPKEGHSFFLCGEKAHAGNRLPSGNVRQKPYCNLGNFHLCGHVAKENSCTFLCLTRH